MKKFDHVSGAELKRPQVSRQAIRLLIPVFLVVVISALLIGHSAEKKRYTDLNLKGEEDRLRATSQLVTGIDPVISDVRYLSGNDNFRTAIVPQGEAQQSALIADWLAFASAKPQYDQLRWIDETGRERLRIDAKDGVANAVEETGLQDKKDRYYFQNAAALRAGEIYVSPLDLNIEHETIEQPYKPMIRIATPAIDKNGERRGIVIVNFKAGPLLENYRALDPGNLWLVNPDGYWLVGPQTDLEWGFMFNEPEKTLSQKFPHLWQRLASAEQGQFRDRQGVWTYNWVSPVEATSDHREANAGAPKIISDERWLVLDHTPRSAYAGGVIKGWLAVLAGAAAILIFATILIWKHAASQLRERHAARNLAHSNTALSEKVLELNGEIQTRKSAENELRSALELYRAILRNSIESFLLLDREGNIREANDAFCSLVGRQLEQIVGHNIEEFGFDDLKSDLMLLLKNVEHHGQSSMEAAIRVRAGEDIFIELNLVYLFQSNNIFAFMRNVTDQQIHIGELERNAYYDVLTNLPNRLLLNSRLTQAAELAERNETELALLFLDLDGFKSINDHFGHDTGDEVLIHIARRFASSLRPSDTIARLGGDEFVALLPSVTSRHGVETVVNRLLEAARKPVLTSRGPQTVSASIGVAVIGPHDAKDAELLLQRADHAMYQAKMNGKDQSFFSDNMPGAVASNSGQIATDVRHAIELDQFVLYYQPKIDALTGQIVGLEALIRWNHPERGLILPGAFLPEIEMHPVYIHLGEWVRRTAIRQIAEWNAAGFRTSVSINVSVGEILEASLVESFKTLLDTFPGVEGNQIEIEVLETNEIGDNQKVVSTIRQCKALGIRIAIDDFGTGYSSLSQLRQLEVDTLKIDRTFVDHCTVDPDDLSILIAVFSLSTALHCGVVAEGVETIEQGVLLLGLGCNYMQGFLIAKPMPAAEIQKWASTWTLPVGLTRQYQLRQEDYGLVISGVYHRAWMRRLKAVANNLANHDGRSDLELDPHKCRFGQWLHKEGNERYRAYPEMQEIFRLHSLIHQRAATFLNDVHGGQPFAEDSYNAIYELNKTLEENLLKILIQRTHGGQS